MSAVVSILLLVLGAVLYVAAGLEAVGLIVMIVGALAAGISLWQLLLLVRRGRRPPAQPR